MKLWNFRR